METLAFFNQAATLVQNTMSMRLDWLRRLLDPRRDIEQECGHPADLNVTDYDRAYVRGDIASRVVDIWPDECWGRDPEVFESDDETETEFEKAWKSLNRKMNLTSMLHRADRLSGVGRYGIMLLGVSDGKTLDQPLDLVEQATLSQKPGSEPFVPVKSNLQLLYVRPLDEYLLRITRVDQDTSSPRYGHPLLYQVQFANQTETQAGDIVGTSTQIVHWTRVIHLADNRKNSEVYGEPRLKKVFNRILDLQKVAGGSGEMFWKGGFPGLSLETMPGLAENGIQFDAKSTKAELDAYMNGLQRYIATFGMTVKSLSVQVADPTAHIEAQIRLVAMALAVPWRVFMGAEKGQLASEQDIRSWNTRVARRREEYVTPLVIRPFVDRLILLGILPPPLDPEEGYQVDWPDLNMVSDLDEATVAMNRTTALTSYISAGGDQLMPPFQYLTLILGLSDDEAHACIDAATQGDSLPVDHPAVQPTPMDQAQIALIQDRNGAPPAITR